MANDLGAILTELANRFPKGVDRKGTHVVDGGDYRFYENSYA